MIDTLVVDEAVTEGVRELNSDPDTKGVSVYIAVDDIDILIDTDPDPE